MYNNDGWGYALLDILGLGAMYMMGRHQGEQKVLKQVADKHRDDEIAALKRQINDLKNKRA